MFNRNDWVYSDPCLSPEVLDDALFRAPLNETAIPFTVVTPIPKSNAIAAILYCGPHHPTTFSFVAEFKNGNSYLSTEVCHVLVKTFSLSFS